MHAPQNVLAETELRHLAAIPYQIISPASNSPIIGIYQDSLLGAYQFTRPNINFTPREAMKLLMMYPNVNTQALKEEFENKEHISNFEILTQIMPPLTLKYKTKLFGDNEKFETSNNVLEITNGKWIRGQIEKSLIHSTTKGVLHRVFNDFGNMACSNFIDNLQNIITEYMKMSSFSVGISDLIANKEIIEGIIQVIYNKKVEVQTLIEKVRLGIFENKTSRTNKLEFEIQVNQLLNKAMEESGKIGRNSLGEDNRFLKIVNSGSKGNLINISQMISGLGQQNVDGQRIPYGFDSRTLPHYFKYDDGPNARGFIENSYISGLTANELFFHAMAGRIGLIDTAIKTSSTGYIQRRLIKGLEDLKVEYDMTVRNSKGKIIQFEYGEDGFDTTKVESQIIPLTEMTLEDIYVHYDILGLDENDKEMLKVYTKSTATRVVKQRAETREMCKKYVDLMIKERNNIVKSVFKNKNDNMVKLPVSFQNIINNIQGQLELNGNSIVDITPLEAFKMIESYFAKLETSAFISPNRLFKNIYFYYLSPKDLLVNKRFHSKALTLLLETVILKYNQSVVHPGEMVGIIAGQSVGEPTTQMTLNTFHHSGTATGSNVTRGVPRVEELLRLTKNPKNPCLTIRLKPYDETDRDRAIAFANMIEYTKLVDVVKSVKICFDPFDKGTNIEEDKKWLEEFYEFEQIMEECIGEDKEETKLKKSKWVLRMEMDAEILLDKNITIDDIHFAIKNSSFGDTVDCAFSDFNNSNLIFRVRIVKEDLKKQKPTTLDQSDEIYLLKNFQDTILNDIVLRGINGITNILPRKLQNMVVEEDGKFIRKDIWALETTGSNFLHVLGLDFIDTNNTYSNDIREVYDILGIEAARQMLFNEITEVMEHNDSFINYHHLSLLCDRMCIKENLVPIFRSGILNDNIGPIAKSTFEVHTEVLLTAAKHAELDHMRGVSASVMCGQYGNYGTGAFNLILDMNEMHKLTDMAINTENADDEIAKQFGFRKMDKCSNLEIQNNISNIQRTTGGEICEDNYNMGF